MLVVSILFLALTVSFTVSFTFGILLDNNGYIA